MDVRILYKLIQEHFPEKILVETSDYQNDEEQSYKSLFEELIGMYNSLLAQHEKSQHELEESQKQVENLVKELDSANRSQNYLNEISSLIETLVKKSITISNIRPVDKKGMEVLASSDNDKVYCCDDLANFPGIYGFQRPSLFTEIEIEYNKINSAKRLVAEAEKDMRHRICFWKNKKKMMKEQSVSLESLMNNVDQERKERITALLNDSQMSNEEKYLKYMLLTPGMNKEYLKTLMGADEIGINANVLIELLEQPEESFCKEIIEAYVSEVRKGNGYNLKREVAEELLKGDWCVVSDINGEPCKYQLLPIEKINEIKKELENLANNLTNTNTSEPIQQNAEELNDNNMMAFSEYETAQQELAEEFLSEQVEFDDSMIDL